MSKVTFHVEDEHYDALEERARARGIDDVDTYLQKLVTSMVRQLVSHERDREIDEETEATLEDLGYL